MFVLCLFCLSSNSDAQIEGAHEVQLEQDEILSENSEVNEELNIKRRSKMNIEDFLADEELSALYLNKNQKQAITKHIENTGKIIDLLELQTIVPISYNDYLRLKSILKIEENGYTGSKSSIRFLERSGYQSKKPENSVGSQWSNYQQLKITTKRNIYIGLAREYDVGENSSDKLYAKNYDHYAYFLQKKWKYSEIALGNYQVYQGFGLLIGQGFSGSFGGGGINNIIQQRWNPQANQSEINISQGLYYRQFLKYCTINIGINHQKVDEGTATGYHRTASEKNRKDMRTESSFLLGMEQHSRTLHQSLLFIKDKYVPGLALSYSPQYYYRNYTVFGEFAMNSTGQAFCLGISTLLGKDVQISLSNTRFSKNYESKWAAPSTQGFNVNDGLGYVIHLMFPYKRKWLLNVSHRFNTITGTPPHNLGKKIENTESLRIDRAFNKELKIAGIFILQNKNTDGNDAENSFQESNTFRCRITLKKNIQAESSQEIQYYHASVEKNTSNGIAYQFIHKRRYYKIIYSIGVFDINKGSTIYYSSDNVIISRATSALYNSGTVHHLGISAKPWRKINCSIQLSNTSNSLDRTSTYKLLTSIKYP